MPSTLQRIPHERDVLGMDVTTLPHLIQEGRWRVMYNMRPSISGVSQVPPWQLKRAFTADSIKTAVHIPSLNNTRRGVHVLGLSNSKAYKMNLAPVSDPGFDFIQLPIDGVLGTFTTFIGPDAENPSSRQIPWSVTMYNNQAWFVNHLNKVHYSEGTQVRSVPDSPMASYIENFFDHLVVANDIFGGDQNPTRVRWSDLYNVTEWTPRPENEADFFDIVDWVSGGLDTYRITGMAKLNDLLVIYTPSSVVGCRYIGKPKVMQFFPIAQDVGNGAPNALVAYRNMHFFYSVTENDFFMYDGQQLSSIGGPIAGASAAIKTLQLFSQRFDTMLGYVIPEQTEACWVFRTTLLPLPSAGTLGSSHSTYSLVYNWRLKEWSIRATKGLNCTQGYHRPVYTIDRYTRVGFTMNSLSPNPLSPATIDYSPTGIDPTTRYFYVASSAGGVGFMEEYDALWNENLIVTPEEIPDPLTYSHPFLETRDMFYGDSSRIKEMSGIEIDSSSPGDLGIKVELSARTHFSEPVVFKNVGTWLPTLPDRHLAFRHVPGRIFRWRFSPMLNPCVDWRWYSYVEYVYISQPDK
jgi:hypothetical protein